MLFRTPAGNMVEIKRNDYPSDKSYYKAMARIFTTATTTGIATTGTAITTNDWTPPSWLLISELH